MTPPYQPDAALFPAPHAGRFVPHLRRRRHSGNSASPRTVRRLLAAIFLVSIFLRGGCDGLGVLAPVDDAHYRAARNAFLRIAEKRRKGRNSVKQAYSGRIGAPSGCRALHEL